MSASVAEGIAEGAGVSAYDSTRCPKVPQHSSTATNSRQRRRFLFIMAFPFLILTFNRNKTIFAAGIAPGFIL